MYYINETPNNRSTNSSFCNYNKKKLTKQIVIQTIQKESYHP